MPEDQRRCVVLPRVRVRAWYGQPPVDVPTYPVKEVVDALETEYRSDACMVPYAPVGEDVGTCPRLGAAAQAYWANRPDEDEPTVGVVPVDIDYDDHAVPPDDWHEEIVDAVEWPCGWYRTPHGLRLVFLPRSPVPISVANDYIRRLHDRLEAWGIKTDASTRTWYRLFKLPRALGRDLPRDFDGMEPLDWHPDGLVEASPGDVGPIIDRARPDEGSMAKVTKTRLKPIGDAKLREDLYHGRLSAPVGERHRTLLKVALQVVEAFETADPLVPFEILAPSAASMGKQLDELWRICEWTCAQRSGEEVAESETYDQRLDEAAEAMGCSRSEALGRLVVDSGAEFFVWDEGRLEYSTGYTHSHQLLGALRRHAPVLMSWAIEANASMALVSKHSAVVAVDLIYTYDEHVSGYDPEKYRMYVPVCQRDKTLGAVYHEDVERWLEALFGDKVDECMDWLATFPDLTRPTCALYLNGPASVGKQMFALGLARLYSTESTTTRYEELTSDFCPTLKRSPIIWADEKVPQDAFAKNDSSLFRRIVGNTSLPLNEKYRTTATLDGNPRVLITANNSDALAIREELDQQDIDAIRVRVGYVECDESPRDVLRELAGERSTREYTESWVRGGAIAEHVLWLEENRDVRRGDRFAVEGWDSKLTRQLPTRAGAAGMITELVGSAVIRGRDDQDAVRWFDGGVYVSSSLLGKEWESLAGHSNDRVPGSSARTKALRSLSLGEQRRLTTRYEDGRLRYWTLDPEIVGRIVEERGLCDASDIVERASRPSSEEGAAIKHADVFTKTPETRS